MRVERWSFSMAHWKTRAPWLRVSGLSKESQTSSDWERTMKKKKPRPLLLCLQSQLLFQLRTTLPMTSGEDFSSRMARRPRWSLQCFQQSLATRSLVQALTQSAHSISSELATQTEMPYLLNNMMSSILLHTRESLTEKKWLGLGHSKVRKAISK